MPNPPITSIDFSTGTARVVAADKVFVFPIAPPKAVQAAPKPPLPPVSPPAPPPASPAPPAPPAGQIIELADMPVTPGVVMTLPAGRMVKPKHFEPQDCPLLVQGAGMRLTTLHGRGGIGSGNRLAWGKGFIHAKGSVSLRDVGLEDCGRHDGKSDAETSVYVEDPESEATVELVRVALDWCENGLFVPNPPTGARVNAVVDRCVFGRTGPNGADDGLSHDIYVSGKSLTVRDSIFVGNSKGNTIKSRSATILIERNWVGRGNGRWIDAPCASSLVSRGNKYVTLAGADSANALGLYDENDTRHPGGGNFLFEGDEFYLSRANGEVFWLPDRRSVATFKDCKLFWVGPPGSTPPSLELRGPGTVIGLNTALTEANRVDAAPAMPADPKG